MPFRLFRKPDVLSRCKPFLGTYVEVSLSGDADEWSLLDASTRAFAAIDRVHRLMSFHDPQSELSYINRQAVAGPVGISRDTEAVLRCALDLSRQSNGAFDISVAPHLVARGLLPDHRGGHYDGTWADIHLDQGAVRFARPLLIDLGGIAKGYAVDMAIEAVQSLAPNIHAVVNAGGDMRMTHWRGEKICMRPADLDQVRGFDQVPMFAPAVATSAGTFLDGRSAIYVPRCGDFANMAKSVSVFAPSCMAADALTKVAAAGDCSEALLSAFDAKVVVTDAGGRFSGAEMRN